MKTTRNPGLGARMGSVEAALASSRSSTPSASTPADSEDAIATSVRLPKSMHGSLTDIVYAERKRGNRISIHSLILEGVEKVIAERK
jgi:hypothetical protein